MFLANFFAAVGSKNKPKKFASFSFNFFVSLRFTLSSLNLLFAITVEGGPRK